VTFVLLQLFASVVAEPVSGTCCGDAGALSDTFSVAEKLPVVVGLNVTTSWQLFPAATAVVQVLDVTLKLPALVPEIDVALMFSAEVPLLVTVSVIGAIEPDRISPAASVDGKKEMPAPDETPVPESVTACGEPVALSEMLTEAR